MTSEDRQFLKHFFRQVSERPLEPDDPLYVDIYQDRTLTPSDPVELLARGVEWTPGESVQLFSGFRGAGKSTELRRLRRRLQENGYLVALADMDDYVHQAAPLDVSDFLIAIAGAFGEKLAEGGWLDPSELKGGYWERLVGLARRLKLEELAVTAGPLDVKVGLKQDPSFKQRIQQRMAGHIGALVADVRKFIEDCVKQVRARHGQDKEIVFLVDSVEHVRGTFVNAEAVQSSVETVFAGHPEKLRLPYVHVVYTVPPYLKVRYPNIGGLFEPGGLQVLPALKVRNPQDGEPWQAGLDSLERIARARGDWEKLLGAREQLDRIALASGGSLRDFLRLLAEIARRADRLPASEAIVGQAINQIRSEFLPLADADARWLARIAETRRAELPDLQRLPDLARFLDTHLVLCYRNEREWYDVHPLIAEEVREQAERLARGDMQSSSEAPAG